MPRDVANARLWETRLDRFRRSGLSLAQFCRKEDISIQAFYYWRRKIDAIHPNLRCSATSPSLPGSASRLLRFTIEAQGIKIECQSESLDAINTILGWATRQQDSGFKQLIVCD